MLVMAVAIFAAMAAAFLVWSMMGNKPQRQVVKQQIDTVKVLVAAKAINFGDEVRANDFSWQEWPKTLATDGYITDVSKPNAIKDLTGAIARTAFLAKEPIKENKLAKLGSGGVMAAILTSGMRAVATKITEESAAGSFILPNDRVDVLVTRKQRSGNGRGEQQVSETLFRNIRVLAIGQEIDQKDGKKTAQGKTATLEMSSQQAETLALANAQGEISLSLRSLEDAMKAKNGQLDEDGPKKDRSTGIKILRYGTWSRTYGLQ
jgi:pilus assembly protein CpaB